MSDSCHYLNDTVVDAPFATGGDTFAFIYTDPLEDLVSRSRDCYSSFVSQYQEALPVSEELLLSLTAHDAFDLLDALDQPEVDQGMKEACPAPDHAMCRLVSEPAIAMGKRKTCEDDNFDRPLKKHAPIPPTSLENNVKKSLHLHSIYFLLPEIPSSPLPSTSQPFPGKQPPTTPPTRDSLHNPAQVAPLNLREAPSVHEGENPATVEQAVCLWQVVVEGKTEANKPCDMSFPATPHGLKMHMETVHKIKMNDKVFCTWPKKDGKACDEHDRIYRHILTQRHIVRTRDGKDISKQSCPKCGEKLSNRDDALRRHKKSSNCITS
jgi:predicted RNA-binding Zn-ribbon protein involved in translation (DUF1610 family)